MEKLHGQYISEEKFASEKETHSNTLQKWCNSYIKDEFTSPNPPPVDQESNKFTEVKAHVSDVTLSENNCNTVLYS